MTSKALLKMGERYDVDLPIVRAVTNVLFDGNSIKETLDALFAREIRDEFWQTD